MKTLTVLLLAIFGVFLAYFYKRFISPLLRRSVPIPLNFSSSVFCNGDNDNIECRFENLCFHQDQFWYFHGVDTKEIGLPRALPLKLDLSSVKDHNTKYFNYVNRTSLPLTVERVTFIQKKSILFHRFNPHNLMHVIHDDLFPFHHTKRQYFPRHEVLAVFMEGRDRGPFYDLYKMFMSEIVTKATLGSFTCFENVVIGVSQKVTWYQYGFHKPQGPINIQGYPRDEIQMFKNNFLKQLNIESDDEPPSTIVLFKRYHTRRIVNEMKLIFKLSTNFKCVVTSLDLEEDSMDHIIKTISNARILIGVHGAHLVTSLFLPPNALVVELFPFGIPSENYTPYKTLAELVNVSYIAWENVREEDSFSFPDRPPELGGIIHLSEEKQREIVATKRIKRHLCCDDIFWLFRIFQDIRVDIDSLVLVIKTKLNIVIQTY